MANYINMMYMNAAAVKPAATTIVVRADDEFLHPAFRNERYSQRSERERSRSRSPDAHRVRRDARSADPACVCKFGEALCAHCIRKGEMRRCAEAKLRQQKQQRERVAARTERMSVAGRGGKAGPAGSILAKARTQHAAGRQRSAWNAQRSRDAATKGGYAIPKPEKKRNMDPEHMPQAQFTPDEWELFGAESVMHLAVSTEQLAVEAERLSQRGR